MTMTPTGPPVDNTPMPGARLPPQGAAAFVQSDAGDIRIGPILAIPQVLQDLGARPQTAFARAGVRLSLFRDPDARLPLEVAGRLFFESARLADCPHVALLVGERFSLGGLGPLGGTSWSLTDTVTGTLATSPARLLATARSCRPLSARASAAVL